MFLELKYEIMEIEFYGEDVGILMWNNMEVVIKWYEFSVVGYWVVMRMVFFLRIWEFW